MKPESKQKPKKIVINSTRKSLVIGKNSITSPKSPSIGRKQGNPNFVSQDENPYSSNYQREKSMQDKLQKMNDQLKYYRDKHDQSLIKVRFLSDQLDTFAGMDKVPPNIKAQISETDSKIKTLQELLNFKRGKQMKKLKKKVKRFVEMMEFQLTQQDLDKIEDQIQIIFFMMDVFTEKYNQMMKDRLQIDQIVDNLKNDTVFNREQLQGQLMEYHDKNIEMNNYIRDLELELFTYKRENYNRNSFDGALRNQNFRIYDDTIKNLQSENEQLAHRVKQLDAQLRQSEFKCINYKRKFEQSQARLMRQQSKYKQIEFQLERVQKEEVRWKQRYSVMQEQKNQRIRLLEEQKRSLQIGKTVLNRRQYNHTIDRKRVFDPKYECHDEILEDSGEEYYDLKENGY